MAATSEPPIGGRNLREPVRFADAVDGMLKADISIFVELGPHPVLLHAIEQTARARGERATTIACGRREAGGKLGVPLGVGAALGVRPSAGVGSCSAHARAFRIAAALPLAA